MDTLCFYNYKYPQKDSFVIVKIKNVNEIGINVILLEYGNIEGMIVIPETTKSNRNIVSKYKIGSKMICRVVNVDENKGFIDLTNQILSEAKTNKLYKKYKITQKLVYIVYNFIENYCNDIKYNDFMKKTFWKLSDDNYSKIIVNCIRKDNMDILNCFDVINLEDFKKILKVSLLK